VTLVGRRAVVVAGVVLPVSGTAEEAGTAEEGPVAVCDGYVTLAVETSGVGVTVGRVAGGSVA